MLAGICHKIHISLNSFFKAVVFTSLYKHFSALNPQRSVSPYAQLLLFHIVFVYRRNVTVLWQPHWELLLWNRDKEKKGEGFLMNTVMKRSWNDFFFYALTGCCMMYCWWGTQDGFCTWNITHTNTLCKHTCTEQLLFPEITCSQ